ncbi:hypothetical protein [Streptomyces sp. NBC_01530]|uniref:hypothetical protein n=1 Tax=Streptomyces sp. NBC_01530 TaxID=2903895 RepID=UPI003868EF1E
MKAAVLAFGARHPLSFVGPDAEPDWKTAEKHFICVIEEIMGEAIPPRGGVTSTVRRAENAAIALLLALNEATAYRCPICVRQQRA